MRLFWCRLTEIRSLRLLASRAERMANVWKHVCVWRGDEWQLNWWAATGSTVDKLATVRKRPFTSVFTTALF